ncbi:MAG TPA: MlaD family protein [Candidatus Acidoferrales bacterium]|nr:MlaD family protein [Candidatus Acidoferrales bacterium]
MKHSEEVKVGAFVLAAIFLLVLSLVLVGGLNVFQKPVSTYTMRTKFAGGMETGAPVRYAGIKVGRVERVSIDPKDPTRAVVAFSIDPETPIRTDSAAQVSSLGLLGEYYVEITPGTLEAEQLPSGSEIPTKESMEWTELVNRFGAATEEAQGLLADARSRVTEVLDNIKDLTGEENRERVRSVLLRMDQILTDARPRVKTVLTNFENTSAKIDAFMDDIKGTREQLDQLLANWGRLAGKEDAEVEKTLRKLRDTLARAEGAMEEVQRLLMANREHLDITMQNLQVSSENIRELSDTLKQRPYSLIRVKNPPERTPGELEKNQ